MTTKTYELTQPQLVLILNGLRSSRQDLLLAIEAADPAPELQWKIESYEQVSKEYLELIQTFLTTFHSKSCGICPVCNGFGYTRISADTRKWYPGKHFHKCTNCGGQYMGVTQTSLGMVSLRRDNSEPCKHEYTYKKLGNCYHGYTCKHCGDYFTIDSGD